VAGCCSHDNESLGSIRNGYSFPVKQISSSQEGLWFMELIRYFDVHTFVPSVTISLPNTEN
jgi:hypothetical protein